ncbi:hypothetical protein RCL_jg3858.t1 [Rhizophagus clarus]|uniref:Secreted protein n=1 Tax=Rhizophagus clarus TaxID=94130 RepID=A0A8H3KSM5_9GLOM|nr:hypothetical protein RCL_jg3858.t1 [Rhizophagus clarus]
MTPKYLVFFLALLISASVVSPCNTGDCGGRIQSIDGICIWQSNGMPYHSFFFTFSFLLYTRKCVVCAVIRHRHPQSSFFRRSINCSDRASLKRKSKMEIERLESMIYRFSDKRN